MQGNVFNILSCISIYILYFVFEIIVLVLLGHALLTFYEFVHLIAIFTNCDIKILFTLPEKHLKINES